VISSGTTLRREPTRATDSIGQSEMGMKFPINLGSPNGIGQRYTPLSATPRNRGIVAGRRVRQRRGWRWLEFRSEGESTHDAMGGAGGDGELLVRVVVLVQQICGGKVKPHASG
jgi:hypothetical protein